MGAGKFGVPYGDIIVNKNAIGFGVAIVGQGVGGGFTVQATGLVGDLVITCSNSEFQVSDDGGSTLYTVLNISPDGNGDIPLTSIYAGYFPTNSGLDVGTITLTNANADTEIITVSGTGRVISNLYVVPFGQDGGTSPYLNFPSDWTLPLGGAPGGSEWIIYDQNDLIPFCALSGSSGGAFMIFANGMAITDYSITGPIDTTGQFNIMVDFNQYRQNGVPVMTLDWSSDGVIWNNVAITEVTDDDAWHFFNQIVLPAGASGQATLYLRFGVVGDGTGTFVAIDDLKVSGQS